MKSFRTHFKSLTANKFAYKALLEVFNTPHVYRVEIPCGASARCLVGPPNIAHRVTTRVSVNSLQHQRPPSVL